MQEHTERPIDAQAKDGRRPAETMLSKVERFMRRSAPGLVEGRLRGELIAGGRSNLTYALTDGTSRWVLRRPPSGPLVATAHDVHREHRVLSALHPTAVPVPRPLCRGDASVFGAPFYVMEHVDGTVFRTVSQLEDVDPVSAASISSDLVEVLVQLHRLDPAEAGLADLGRPAGFLARQLRRWRTQLANGAAVAPGLAVLGDELARVLPPSRAHAIVHGDYRLDNVIVDVSGARVAAVLDWEMATLGDPITDLASMLVWWEGLAGLDNPVAASPSGVAGFPGANALAGEYARATGSDLSDLPWCVACAFYKLGALIEGIVQRAVGETSDDEERVALADMVPALAERGRSALAEWA